MAVDFASVMGGKQVSGVPAFVKPPILPGPVSLDDVPSAVVDEDVVARLKAQFKPIELCAGRIMKEAGLGEEWQVIVAKFLQTPTAERKKITQAIIDAAGDVKEGVVKSWPDYGSADELRVAFKAGKAGGVPQLTRYDFVPQILALGPGKSGAYASISVVAKKGSTDNWVCLEYGRDGQEPLSTLSFPIKEYSMYDFDNADDFFRVMKEDGHEFQRCIASPYVDFLMGLFMAVYTGSWDGNLRRMAFQQRPGAKKFGYKVGNTTYDILDAARSPFSAVLRAMYDAFIKIEVPDTPNNQIGWLFENMPKAVLEAAPSYVRLINTLLSDWQRYSHSVHVLEGSIVTQMQALRTPAGIPGHVFGFVPCSFTQCLEGLEDARLYRGKKEGEGIAAVLNEEGKQVGLDPLGVLNPLYDDVKRYRGIVDEMVKRNVRKCSVYTHRSSFDLAALSKLFEIEFKVFTDHKNTPLAVRDFMYDGRDPSDDAEWVIFDVLPDFKTESGAHPTLIEWNAHRKVLEQIERSTVKNAVVFSRLFTQKVGKGQYEVDLASMAKSWSFAKELAFTFLGCHPHNGEFILWLTRGKQIHQTKNPWFPTVDKPTCEGYAQMVANIVQARVRLANSLRTWAFPLGNLTFDLQPMTFGSGAYEETIDPVRYNADCLALRMLPEVRSLHQETKVKSTAAVFGEEQKRMELEAPPAAFFAVVGAPGEVKPAQVAPAQVLPEAKGSLDDLIPK